MITQDTNFCRIFEIPMEYPEGFCFGGGISVQFKMVDWFNPIPQEDIVNDKLKPWNEYIPMLWDFLSKKTYVKNGRQYLLITNFGECLLFSSLNI